MNSLPQSFAEPAPGQKEQESSSYWWSQTSPCVPLTDSLGGEQCWGRGNADELYCLFFVSVTQVGDQSGKVTYWLSTVVVYWSHHHHIYFQSSSSPWHRAINSNLKVPYFPREMSVSVYLHNMHIRTEIWSTREILPVLDTYTQSTTI